MSVIIETTLGDITVDLYVDERPRSCLNFLKLCKVKYYNYCLFHNVQRNFIAQTGDPTGTGRGGESLFRMLYGDQAKFFDAEKMPKIKHKTAGVVSMVNDGNGYHGSQFLITLGENLDSLDGIHTVFGEVAEGMDVVMKISEAFCDKENRPYQDIRITHTVILDDPLDDPTGLVIPDRSPEPTKEQLEGCFRIGADESVIDDEGIDQEEIKKIEEKKEATHKAQILEIIGDIPDKDVEPPDNVLFVCKLNSITTDDDLEIIFSRFGTIVSCEIIRDWKSGESLQYAFIEFETSEMCEKAYHKMDNVLIDDRRIHVDFSQSVSKMKFPRSNQQKEGEKNPKKEEKRDRSKSPSRKKRHRDASPPTGLRHRSVTPTYREKRRNRDVSPLRGYKRHYNTSPSRERRRDNSSPLRHHRRHRDVSPESRHSNKSYSRIRRPDYDRNGSRDSSSSPASEERKRKMKKEKKKNKQKQRRRGSSSDSEESDNLSSDKEVRCGKHRKRSVQKEDFRRHKHRT
ncbi:unnamed protein product [Clavelina lepadiformis]|uniref:Peptidyl-prolyl cis-trans isomerase n=1 Tax=Clavelina lepadiformis TaxID=159417 RepID=A0ABP0FWS2_CLALP